MTKSEFLKAQHALIDDYITYLKELKLTDPSAIINILRYAEYYGTSFKFEDSIENMDALCERASRLFWEEHNTED